MQVDDRRVLGGERAAIELLRAVQHQQLRGADQHLHLGQLEGDALVVPITWPNALRVAAQSADSSRMYLARPRHIASST